jgi:hypothetical protein
MQAQAQILLARPGKVIGSLRLRLVGHLVRSRNLIPGPQIAGREQTVQLVQRMFWKSWTTLHGARVYVGVLRHAGKVDRYRNTGMERYANGVHTTQQPLSACTRLRLSAPHEMGLTIRFGMTSQQV